MLLAGHETIANSLCWGLLDLAQNPNVQTRLRKEIWDMEKTIEERGGSEFTATDFEAMPYLVAVTKVLLCFHFFLSLSHEDGYGRKPCDTAQHLIALSGKLDETMSCHFRNPSRLPMETSLRSYQYRKA